MFLSRHLKLILSRFLRTPNIDVSMDKPHPRFLASILLKKVRLIRGRLRYINFCVMQNYVSFTARHLHQRIGEHRYSAISKHLQTQNDNKRAKIDHLFKALKKCRSKFDCLIYKMLFIKDNQALSQHPK